MDQLGLGNRRIFHHLVDCCCTFSSEVGPPILLCPFLVTLPQPQGIFISYTYCVMIAWKYFVLNFSCLNHTDLRTQTEKSDSRFVICCRSRDESKNHPLLLRPCSLSSVYLFLLSFDWRHKELWQIFFSWVPKSLRMVTAAIRLKKMFASWKKSYDKPRQCIKKETSLC